MSGHFDVAGNWIEDQYQEPSFPLPSASISNPTPAPSNEVNIEDTTMVQSFFAKLAQKIVEASDLAKRVGELEAQVQAAANDITQLRNELAAERVNHANTTRELQEVSQKLEHEQRAVHDLVMERDIVVGERNQAQAERDDWKRQKEAWENECKNAQAALNEERERNRVLEERTNVMADRIKALKDALGGLHNL